MVTQMFNWLKESNRWKHLLGGAILGLVSESWYCAILVGASVGAALEFKDKAHGGKWDWIDSAMTLLGALLGYGARYLVELL